MPHRRPSPLFRHARLFVLGHENGPEICNSQPFVRRLPQKRQYVSSVMRQPPNMFQLLPYLRVLRCDAFLFLDVRVDLLFRGSQAARSASYNRIIARRI